MRTIENCSSSSGVGGGGGAAARRTGFETRHEDDEARCGVAPGRTRPFSTPMPSSRARQTNSYDATMPLVELCARRATRVQTILAKCCRVHQSIKKKKKRNQNAKKTPKTMYRVGMTC
jgi:hypothetical protein